MANSAQMHQHSVARPGTAACPFAHATKAGPASALTLAQLFVHGKERPGRQAMHVTGISGSDDGFWTYSGHGQDTDMGPKTNHATRHPSMASHAK